MGATYIAETAQGPTPDAALAALHSRWAEDREWPEPSTWPDPFDKGFVQVWPDPVADCALEWMQGWTRQNPPEGVDPRDKRGPWLAFPLEHGGWCFHGWVST